ncbi:Ig-like domain-containing protein (plasmid) [Aneurinibacillus sp. Ricciae_BoGa-3]|uniref:Ig-like domain-containing protein n=1 Tax=Aneurinibacillus sp. Ricciae_BoGa-3 TaxID=3022697 RepID=UPI0023403B21|nr:Ig-like domain-containing protein [Aneurinibacillus sp. Ricciae_BoGa-3]WCK57167.1 Ig-like domain-containing protein [Aneurinibacillus sp. Ricciae_BoGa-3]
MNPQLYVRADHPTQIEGNAGSVVAGKPGEVKLNVLDQYGNPVENDETITAQFANNILPSQTVNVKDGVADFSFTAPTKSQNIGMSLLVGSNALIYNMPNPLSITHDAPAKAIVTLPSSLSKGQNATVTGTITDQYGNPVDNQTVSFGGALTGSATTASDGAFSANLKVGDAGAVTANIAGQNISLANNNGQPIATISTGFNWVKVGNNWVLPIHTFIKDGDPHITIDLPQNLRAFRMKINGLSATTGFRLITFFYDTADDGRGIYYTNGGFSSWQVPNLGYVWKTFEFGAWNPSTKTGENGYVDSIEVDPL